MRKLKILIQPYNNFSQNTAGGVQTRVREYYKAITTSNTDCQVEFFDKYKHKVEEWDIIHFFKLSIEHYDLMVYARKKGVKIVISSIVPLKDGIKIWTHRLLCKFVPLHTLLDIQCDMLSMSTLILTESKSESAFIHKYYGVSFSKMHVIPDGFSKSITDGNPEIAKQKYGINKFVLQVGRIDSNKNQIGTIRALKNTNIPLVIVGGADPMEPEYLEKCKRESGGNVIYTGWLPLTDPLLSSLYASAKVVVLPSFRETFGNVILEGAANGANIVFSKTLPINEFQLGEGTWTIDPKNIDDIREKIIDAYYKEPTSLLKEKIFREYAWESIVDKHLSLFEKLY